MRYIKKKPISGGFVEGRSFIILILLNENAGYTKKGIKKSGMNGKFTPL